MSAAVLILHLGATQDQGPSVTAPSPSTGPKALTLLYDELADPAALEAVVQLRSERFLIIYQSVDPNAAKSGLIDVEALIGAIRSKEKDGLPNWGMLDFESPFYDVLAKGPDDPDFARTVRTMIEAIRAVKAAFPATKWCFYGLPQMPYWIGPKPQDWLSAPADVKRAQVQKAIKTFGAIAAEMDWMSPSIYGVYAPESVKSQEPSLTREQGRTWRRAVVGLSKMMARGKPVLPIICPWWCPGGSAPYCRVIPRREFLEDIVAPAIDFGASGFALWSAMNYQIARVTAADPSRFGDETNFGTREWRAAMTLDYLGGKTPERWDDPSIRAALVSGMSSTVMNTMRDIRNWSESRKLPP